MTNVERKKDCLFLKMVLHSNKLEESAFFVISTFHLSLQREKMNIGIWKKQKKTSFSKCSRKLNKKARKLDFVQQPQKCLISHKSGLSWMINLSFVEKEMHFKRLIVKLLLPFRGFALIKTTCWLMNTSTLICHKASESSKRL